MVAHVSTAEWGVDQSRPSRYSALGVTLHWVMAIVVLIAFLYGPGGAETRVYAAARDFDRRLHETLGLTVFALAIMRVLWRFGARPPELTNEDRWMVLAARGVQLAMYILFFALPATAISGAWLEGHPLTLLADIEVPPPLGESHALGARIAKLHTWLGDAIMWLAGLHALAGLFHHFVLKDGVLKSMLPRWLLRDD